jgi:hypothetical protein
MVGDFSTSELSEPSDGDIMKIVAIFRVVARVVTGEG